MDNISQEPDFQPSNTPFDISKYEKNIYEINRSQILESLIPNGENKQALDIGCGPGYFSSILSNKGWITTSIDTDPQNLEMARNYANEVYLGNAITVISEQIQENYCDLVILLEVIEHLPKNLGTVLLEKISRVLKPGGKLIISTPNKLSPEGLGGYYWSEKIRGRKWNAWDNTHIHIYSSLEIIELLKKCEFLIEGITGYWYEGQLPVIGKWKLPIYKSTKFPLNLMGFNVIIECKKK